MKYDWFEKFEEWVGSDKIRLTYLNDTYVDNINVIPIFKYEYGKPKELTLAIEGHDWQYIRAGAEGEFQFVETVEGTHKQIQCLVIYSPFINKGDNELDIDVSNNKTFHFIKVEV